MFSTIAGDYIRQVRLGQTGVRSLRFLSSGGGSSWNWNASTAKSSNESSTSGPIATTSVDAKIQNDVMDKCASLHASLMPLNKKLDGPLAKIADKGTALPFVFLVGNHSSGKSSFVNFVMGRNIQTAGVAPTDDCFTVITSGDEDTDQDGPALIGDPDMGFGGLRIFGPTLIHHTQLKVRKDIRNSNFMLVDSPGMIDSPHKDTQDRGYDFQAVVKWFAERADVVLLFFDPDKPGTTGETLSILLHSLAGMDHKLLIVLNKADQFKKIHDFARAYGSLCWNLSKVIPRKDLPRIFTMCLPVNDGTKSEDAPAGLADLHQTRHDVVAEVMKAPKRRIDNLITHLHDSVHLLQMHSRLIQDVRQRFRKRLWEHRMQSGLTLLTGSSLTVLGFYVDLPLYFTGGVMGATVLGVGALSYYNATQLTQVEKNMVTPEELSAAFQRCYAREVSEADEFTASVWQRIRDQLRLSLQQGSLIDLPTTSSSEMRHLESIIAAEIPTLRRLASPTKNSWFGGSSDSDGSSEGK